MMPFIRLVRPYDWVKNAFLFAPLFFTPERLSFFSIKVVLFGFMLFSLNASSIYTLNDLRDAHADSLHPKKRLRPIASGAVSKKQAVVLFFILALVSLLGAYFLLPAFALILAAYFVLNLAYCFGLKQIAIVDVYCIATGFVLRVLAGAALVSVAPSIWILLCTGFLSLFLALAKRRDDLVRRIDAAHRGSIKGYNIIFVDICIAIILSALLISYSIYTTVGSAVNSHHFFLTVPIVLFGVLRYLQITYVEERSGSPTALLYQDRSLLATVLFWMIVSAFLMYAF